LESGPFKGAKVKPAHKHKSSKSHESVLVTAAESIGSALGTLAAKASAAQKSVENFHVIDKLEREGKKIIRKTRASVGKAAPRRRHRKIRSRATKRSTHRRSNS
jgi:hypothetical protein